MFLQMFSQLRLRGRCALCSMVVGAGIRDVPCAELTRPRKAGMPNLTESDRQALRLADGLQKAVEQWLSSRGVDQPCTVSPFVDPGGQPAVLIRMNAHVAHAMIDSLHQQDARFAE
jgi:hypothetical protein